MGTANRGLGCVLWMVINTSINNLGVPFPSTSRFSVIIYGMNSKLHVSQGCKNYRRQVARVTTFCTVAPNIRGFSGLSLLHVSLLEPIISRWLLTYWKNCAPLTQSQQESVITETKNHEATDVHGFFP